MNIHGSGEDSLEGLAELRDEMPTVIRITNENAIYQKTRRVYL